jgi:hypothetical protein
MIPADSVRLGQVISNLVSNALKFTETGHVLVRLEPDPDSQFWRLIVQDTGIGIADDKISGIFSAFSQEDQTTTRRFGGTGLGLSISKRLVEAMGGQIGATSKQGHGTSFHVRLPALTGEARVLAAPPKLEEGDVPSCVKIFVDGQVESWAISRRLATAGAVIGQTDALRPDLLIADKANRFEGFECSSGQEQIIVDAWGRVARGHCRQGGHLGSIGGLINWPTTSVVCRRPSCDNAFDILATKTN